MHHKNIPSSFRDPSGFVFSEGRLIYRQVNLIYKDNYELLINSGLYEKLVSSGLLIPHEEVNLQEARDKYTYKIIKPQLIPFISYPYEWCFSQLKDAALVTLEIQKKALEYGMVLKDASSYNIQFIEGKPVLIDTLSFERYQESTPWKAYKQFCGHFLAPLALMYYVDIRLNQLLRIYIDGLPLELVNRLLPFRAQFNPNIFLHIYLHDKFQRRYSFIPLDKKTFRTRYNLSSLQGLIASLESSIKKLTWPIKKSQWSDYYPESKSYTQASVNHKKQIVSNFLDGVSPQTAWDLGANTGLFSRIASNKGIFTVAFDNDPFCVEINYQESIKNCETNILPLLLDLTNPSPGIGWENKERMTIFERGPVDVVLALALIHHLAILNNLPFNKIVSFFKKLCKWLIIEFVPKDDEMVKKFLSVREDIFTDYTKENFEKEFSNAFKIHECVKIRDSKRVLYLMEKKN